MKTNNLHFKTLSPQSSKTIAIIQTNRLGDIIQTAQAISGLKAQYPEYRLILIGRSQFVTPLNFLLKKHFDQIYSLDTQKIFRQKEMTSLQSAKEELQLFLQELKNENIDALVNLSFSKSSQYLTSIIPSTHKVGPYFDLSNRLIIEDKWSQMLYSTVMRGKLNPYALIDLFKNIIGAKENTPKLKLISNHERKKQIIVHPFASSERKIWRNEKWVEIIYRMLKENESYSVVIVGAKSEYQKSMLITENPLLKSFAGRLINATGKLSLQELKNEIGQSKVFLGHDSMVGHLAAIAETPTLTISLGSVRPQETTPYHSKAYNLAPRTKCFPCFPSDQCSYYQCHHDIPYQVVCSSIKELCEQGQLTKEWCKKNISSFHASSINFYHGKIIENKMRLETIINAHQDIDDIYRIFYRMAWSFIISDTEETFPFPELTPITHRHLLNGLTGLQHLYELSEFGKKYSQYILEEIASTAPSIAKIKEFSKKIDEIDHLQKMVQKTAPELAPIIDYFVVRKGNLAGENVVELTESSYLVFHESSQLCQVMYDLIENAISEYKNNNKQSNSRAENNK